MSDYLIVFTRSARRELERLPNREVNRIFPKIEALAKEPRPSGCRKLVGETNLWRLRVGQYRVIYSIDDRDHIIDIIAVRHRSEAYR
jgi:mRNA interferase RelE/StbE